MKARKLKQILNNTGYTVAFYGDYIGIGSPLCHNLIKFDIEKRKITYALDTWRNDRGSVLHHEELTFIWDKLEELVDNGGMADIINGNDVIENPLPVYTVRNGALLCTVTDAYGWPNVTIEGYMMHDNDYFKTAAEALEYGIKEYEARASHLAERLKELQNESSRIELLILESKDIVAGLKLLNPVAKERCYHNMNEKIKQHLIAVAEKNNWPTDDDTLIEILTEANEVYVKKVSDSRWWYTEFIVAEVEGMLIGYEYAKANRDESVRDLGWEFDETTICEVEAVQETVTVYKKLNPAKGAVINTMITDPKEQPEEVKAPTTETEQEQVPGEATQEETEG